MKLLLKAEPEYLNAINITTVEGTLCATVSCSDYDEYRHLPGVVSYTESGVEILLGKSGWNSDTGRAHYVSRAEFLKVVKSKTS